MIILPKVYTTLPICLLHVVNNDTMEQVPTVFQKVVPCLYPKNKVGAKCIIRCEKNSGEWELLSQWQADELAVYLGGRGHCFNETECCSILHILERTHCTCPLLNPKPYQIQKQIQEFIWSYTETGQACLYLTCSLCSSLKHLVMVAGEGTEITCPAPSLTL